MKGIYPYGKKFIVRKYGFWIGLFDTYEEAKDAAIKAEERQEEAKMWEQYETSRDYLISKGLLNP